MQKEAGEKIHKFFITSQQQATIRCPECGISKTFDVTKLNMMSPRFKVTCKCGKIFRAEIEFRKHYRKTVRLSGTYSHLNSPKRGDMMVVDLSMVGLGFTTSTPHGLKVGDHLDVLFRLDNRLRSEIRLKVVVRNIKDLFVGVERTDMALTLQDLGFYLM
jgi:hypothetical protein